MSEVTKEELTFLQAFIKKFTPSSKNEEVTAQTSEVLKQFDKEEMTVVEPLFIAGGEVDGQGDGYKDDVEGPKQLVKALVEGLEAGVVQSSWFHKGKTKSFTILKAWVTEKEETLDNGVVIPANQPIVITKFSNKSAYKARVEGRLGGLSIGALGSAEILKGLMEDLKITKTPSRLLSDFILTHKGAHVAYTSWSQGGAASEKNEPFMIVKSKEQVILSKEEQDLYDEFGEDLTPLEKAKKLAEAKEVEATAPSTSDTEAQDAGVDNQNLNKGQEMSEHEEVIRALQLEVKAGKIEKSLAAYSFSSEVSEGLAMAMAKLKDASVITKALDEVKAAKEAELAELSKAIEVAKEEKVAAEASELEKALTEEKGKAEPTQSVTAEESASDINEVYQNFLKSKGIPTEESK